MTGRWRRGREREREREVGRAHADLTLQGEESGVVVLYAKRECGIRDQLGVGRWSLNLGGLEIGRRRLDVERVAVFSCLIVHTSYGSWRFIPIHIVGRTVVPAQNASLQIRTTNRVSATAIKAVHRGSGGS